MHGPGDVQGEPVQLDQELYDFTVDAYAHDARGRRLYDSAFFSRPKGRDKSGHAGRVVLFEALGPCRFAGFAEGGELFTWRDFAYEYQPGEPMGRPVTSPFIRCLATEEGQAGNTYDNVYFNLTEGPLAEGLPRDAAGLTRTYIPGGGEIVPSTAANASKDGGKESFCVFDETHLMVLPSLKAMYRTVRRNMAKRRNASPWSLETSTMYVTGQDSVAEETHHLAQKLIESKERRAAGKLILGDPRVMRLFFDHRFGNPEVDLTDESALREALEEAYGPFAEVMDLDRVIAEIWDPRNPPSQSRQYFLNVASGASDAWVLEHQWAARYDADKIVADREAITLGFDGSRKRSASVTDATALIGCRVSDGHLFELGVWEQPAGPAGDGWRVPVTEVDAAVDYAFSRWNVVGFYADPAKWETYVAAWAAKYGPRLKVKASRDHPIEWWMTGGRSHLIVKAVGLFLGALLDGELSHGGDYALTRHVLNARIRPTTSGLTISKPHPDSPQKIDAAIAGILAYQARVDAIAKGVNAPSTSFVPRRIR